MENKAAMLASLRFIFALKDNLMKLCRRLLLCTSSAKRSWPTKLFKHKILNDKHVEAAQTFPGLMSASTAQISKEVLFQRSYMNDHSS